MIIGSAQSLTPSLVQSSLEFRKQIDPSYSNPPPTQSPQIPSDNTINSDSIEERRDTARQSAVYAVEIKHTKNMFNTYVEASQTDHSESTTIDSPDPAEVYRASLKYSRREDLMAAFEQASQQKTNGLIVDVVV